MQDYWLKTIEFFSFQDLNIRYVAFGSMLLAVSAAVTGTFTFLRKKALAGDAVAHAVLPGVCLAFLFTGTKNPVWLIIGAFISGWIALSLVDLISRLSIIKEDTAIGMVLSVFFGFGILLLTAIQHGGNAAQAGLDSFIFGKAAALTGSDLYIFSGTAFVLPIIVFICYKEFKLISFDENFARVIGFPVRRLEILLTGLTVLAVVVGIQAVGVVLMAAMLITPAAAARFWTDKLSFMLVLGAIFGALSGLVGAWISFLEPKMPTGPWIVLSVSFLAIFSFLFAPGRGILYRMYRQRQHRIKFTDENILKLFYKLGEKSRDFLAVRNIDEMISARSFSVFLLRKSLSRLKKQGYLIGENSGWRFSNEGFERGKKITKLHRLWELYLTECLHLAPESVHDDAETMEHLITPEIEKKLLERLKNPTSDPHNSEIPG